MTTGVRTSAGASPTLPAALLDEVDEHCRALAATAVGRLFTVPTESAESALESQARSGARYDTILSFMRTPLVTSLEDYIAAIEQVLADEGWLGMVEPAGLYRGALPGWLTVRSRRPSPPPRPRGRDVVSAVRSRGLVITDIHRREARSAPAGWRQYVVLRARSATPRPEGP